MELQQQHQQLVTLEGFESSQARTIIFKLINVVLAVLQVILVLVSTMANILTPLLRTRWVCARDACHVMRVTLRGVVGTNTSEELITQKINSRFLRWNRESRFQEIAN